MQPIRFTRATTISGAINFRKENPDSAFLAGGTNLVDLMKMDIEHPTRIVDINRLDLSSIRILSEGSVSIGALVKNSVLAYDEYVMKHYPVLSQALLSGASPQLRNMATVGGNIMQRTRCPYFFGKGFACNKKHPGSGCAAINGYNRPHAILGVSDHCIATHPSDMCVALAALNAIVHIKSADSARSVLFADFHLLPGSTPEKETTLQPGDLIMAVELPPLSPGSSSYYLKLRDRSSYDFALSSVAAVMKIQENKIESASLALGGVGTKPWRCRESEKILVGATISEDAKPGKYNSFKIELAKRNIYSVLSKLGGIA
jgi:xanthine dehydrogenase YagS FAD-binding subunit